MSYATVEVELRDGRVIARDGEKLPTSGHALLVLLDSQAPPDAGNKGDVLQALKEIRSRQASRNHVPPSAESVAQQVRSERESWE